MAELTTFQDWPWQHWASIQPDAIALATDDTVWTWQQLNCHIIELAKHFHHQGLKSHQTVVLMGKNSLELLLCQLAILRCGARVLPINPRLPHSLLRELLPHLNINFVINFSDITENSLEIPSLSVANISAFTDLSTDSLPIFSDVKQQVATLILTSGSTGLPKAAAHSIEAHLDSANGVLNAMNYQKNDCWLLSLPLFHVSGQGILWRWLLRGGCIAVKTSTLTEALQGVTHASLVPTQLWRLLNQTGESTLTLKQVLLGGAVIPTSLTDLAASQGIECWSGYGMTEMASTVCAKRADGKKGVGLPLLGKRIRLADNEIQIQSKSQAMGYWFNGKIVPLNMTNGWFKTNDKGAFIDGEYQVIGRLDNLFISGGECVQPEDIESIINAHPSVEQSFIVPIDDAEFGQRGVAVIELTENIELTSIASWLKDKLAPYQYPVYFYRLANELKGNGIKISRRQISQWVEEQIKVDK